jgi:hypothetical protein
LVPFLKRSVAAAISSLDRQATQLGLSKESAFFLSLFPPLARPLATSPGIERALSAAAGKMEENELLLLLLLR